MDSMKNPAPFLIQENREVILSHDGLARDPETAVAAMARLTALGYNLTDFGQSRVEVSLADVSTMLETTAVERAPYSAQQTVILVAARDAGLLEQNRLTGDLRSVVHYGTVTCKQSVIGILRELGIEVGDQLAGTTDTFHVRVYDRRTVDLEVFGGDVHAEIFPRYDIAEHLGYFYEPIAESTPTLTLRTEQAFVRFLIHSEHNVDRLTGDASHELDAWQHALEGIDGMLATRAQHAAAVAPAAPDVTAIDREYTVSLYCERRTQEDDIAGDSGATDCEMQHERIDGDHLLRLARDNGINAASASHLPTMGAGAVWFMSTAPSADREYFENGVEKYYTLNVHEADGEPLTPDDLKSVAALIGVSITDSRELERDTDLAI